MSFTGNLSQYYATVFCEQYAALDNNEDREEMLRHLMHVEALKLWVVSNMANNEETSENFMIAVVNTIDFHDLYDETLSEMDNYDLRCFKCNVPAIDFMEFHEPEKCKLLCGECTD
jgi:hypothetical protein